MGTKTGAKEQQKAKAPVFFLDANEIVSWYHSLFSIAITE